MNFKKQISLLAAVLVVGLSSGCENNGGPTDHDKCNPDNQAPGEQSIRISVRGGADQALKYRVRSGMVFVLDDIALGSVEDVHEQSLMTVGQVWPGGVVYYEMASDMPSPERITTAMEEWNTVTNGRIRFEKRTTQRDYVSIVHKENACWSYIGMNGGKQELNLGTKCSTGNAVHELGHVLGLWHEQSRGDRDNFVKILWCNIDANERDNFVKAGSEATDIGEYDYGSIMHYTATAFAKSFGLKTIESKTSTPVPGVRGDHTSGGDQASVICMYDKTVPCP